VTKQEEQRGQEVRGSETNIGGDVKGPVLSGRFDGPVSVYSRSQLEELNDYLAQAIAAYEARMYRHLRPSAAPPDQPYKFLYAFEIEDAPIFFGRDAASKALHETVLQDRMTVLHAKSGAGKTSLLKAGLSPQLIREGRLPVYARAYEDPVQAVKRAIAPPSAGPWSELLPKLSLHEFLGLACKHLSRDTQELVIILDQFEEFFVFWQASDHRQPFVEALASCYENTSLRVRFVIGIRGDYFTQLATFQECLPHIFHNEYYLGAMTRDEAQIAITGPVSRLGQATVYEPVLLENLLEDLARGGIELPHLQIICTQLYRAARGKNELICLAAYEELGSAEGILGGYLNGVLDRLPPVEQELAKEILKELVSSEATKRTLPLDKLQSRLAVDPNELRRALTYLVDERLLHRQNAQGGELYEIAHEYLVGEIKTWFDHENLAVKQAQELLEAEARSWRVLKTLIPRDRVEVLYAQRGKLGELDDDMWECILRSALEVDFSALDWVKLASTISDRLLLEILGEEDIEKRERTARILGQLGNPSFVQPLGAVLEDDAGSVRQAAAKALVKIGPPSVEILIKSLQSTSDDTRFLAVNALGDISSPRAIEPLVAILKNDEEMPSTREAAAKALGSLDGEFATEALIWALRVQVGNVNQTVVDSLGHIGEPAVAPLMRTLKDKNVGIRRAAARALARIGEPAVDLLVHALQYGRRDIRWAAAQTLGEIGDHRAVEPLIAALSDRHEHVRMAAIAALDSIGTPEALKALDALDEPG
jgi:HEAT repeat protein